jgi:hypothetical protein
MIGTVRWGRQFCAGVAAAPGILPDEHWAIQIARRRLTGLH